MTSSLLIKIVIPIFPLFNFDQVPNSYISEAIAELLQFDNKLEIEVGELGVFYPSIYLIEDYEPISEKRGFISNCNAIVFQILIPNNYQNLKIEKNTSDEVTREDKIGMFRSLVVEELKRKVLYFLILSQLAKPGSIKSLRGDVFVNEKLVSDFYTILSIHRESRGDIQNLGWPEYKNLKLEKVWNWFQTNHFSFQRHSKSNTERALNAFTHLFKVSLNDNIFDLLWALIGIETLYCSGKEGLSEQIFNKTQIVLGELKDYKKRLKQMYDFRSRLVHGDLDIPPNYYDLYDEENEKFEGSLYDSTVLAVAILTTTLQIMVEENKSSLSFKYILI